MKLDVSDDCAVRTIALPRPWRLSDPGFHADVLGMSSNSYRFFWDPATGQPRTPRPFERSTVTCVDGTEQELIVPAQNTLRFYSNNGQRYASIVTEKVRAIARNQFDCQSLEGAQLENQQDSCTVSSYSALPFSSHDTCPHFSDKLASMLTGRPLG
jgi:hypothetical protein